MKKMLRKLLSFALLSVCCLLFCCPARANGQSDYIRLHIIARSDSLHDQALKLLVRDAIREYTSDLLKDTQDSDQAWEMLRCHESELLTAAQRAAEKYGYEGSVQIELGVFDFPDRTYGEELVPAGQYRAVRIILGEGKGRNWWCVVYPALCLPEDADIDKPVEFYSSIYRWARHFWEVIAS